MTDVSRRSVFINCPFDAEYKPLFHAVTFTALFLGLRVRSALEVSDAGELRLTKIVRLIGSSGFSIHDISRVEHDAGLPRFNMPIELGIAIGARFFGREPASDHRFLILDTERYRYQRFASDLAGIDIHEHGGTVPGMIAATRNFIATHSDRALPGASAIGSALKRFEFGLPTMAAASGQTPDEITYVDRLLHVATFLESPR